MTRGRVSRVPWRRTVAAGALFAGSFTVVYVAYVHTRIGQQLDDLSLAVGGRYADGPLGAAASFGRSDLPVVMAGFAVAIGVVALWRRRWRRCVAAGLIAVLSSGIGQLLKAVLSRPDLGGWGYPYNTLPSGHTIAASSVVLGLLLMVSSAWRRLPVVVIAVVVMAVTGFASVLTQAHLTSDVLCGLLMTGGGAVMVRPLADRSAVPWSGRWVWPVVPLAGLGSVACWYVALIGQEDLSAIALAELLQIVAVAALVVAVLSHLTPRGPGPGADTGYGDYVQDLAEVAAQLS